MKIVVVTNGSRECMGQTKAATDAGYIRAAKRIWHYRGLHKVEIIIYDPRVEEDIFEGKAVFY